MQRIFFIVLGLFLTYALNAQELGTVQGFLFDRETGEPVQFSTLFLKGTRLGTTSDINGYYSLNRIPPGTYILQITNLDYDTLKAPLTVKSGELLQRKFYLRKGGFNLDEVEVSVKQTEKKENTGVALQKIDPVVINKLPSVGEPDVAQYLQVIPGVVFTGDQGGQLYIRGGLPVQNKVLMDGVCIQNPFHSIGLFSVFDSETMKHADVYSAGFGAEYGGRTSSVMDVRIRDGNKKTHSGKVSASTFGVKTMCEGPIIKLTEEGRTSASYLVSIKHSYLPQTSKLLYPYAAAGSLPFYYTDIYGKTSITSESGSKLNVFGFKFNDKVDYNSIARYAWTNSGIGSQFVLVPEGTNLLIEGVFAYSNYSMTFTNPLIEDEYKSSGVSSFNTGFNFVKVNGFNEWRFGFEGVISNTQYAVKIKDMMPGDLSRSTTDLGAFVKYKWLPGNAKKMVIEPSLRFQYYATLGVFSPEPRMALKWNVFERLRFKGSAGLYSQTLASANSDRDVVNLFYGFVNGPSKNNFPKYYYDKNNIAIEMASSTTDGIAQKAQHAVIGAEWDITNALECNIEVYEKDFNQVINVNRDKIFDDVTSNQNRPEVYRKDFIIEQGQCRGFDLTLKYEYKRWYFWGVYSLTYNTRWTHNPFDNSVFIYPPNFDRRHNVNVVGSYALGKVKAWEINLRWNFGSGFPFTQTQGFFNQINPKENINYNFTESNGTLNYIPATLNGGRLPDYHRLDFSIKYSRALTQRNKLEINMGATNVYNRENIFYVDRFTYKRINQLPILPSIHMALTY